MRGKVDGDTSGFDQKGITPAYAGKRYIVDLGDSRFQDHPRLCGEKFRRLRSLSSPFGITPAYAGKSQESESLISRTRDHPRLCGEKHSTFVIRSRRLGSPPPMRGKDNPVYTKK